MLEERAPKSISYSTEIAYLEYALSLQSEELIALRHEMDDFQALPLDAFDDERLTEKAPMQSINLPEKAAFIEAFVNRNFEYNYSPQSQFLRRFENTYTAKLATIILISHALCEATINANLAIALHHVGKAELFLTLESGNLIEKWTVAPLAFYDGYQFPRSGMMYSTLKALSKQRNSLTHQKIHLRDNNDQTVTKGNLVRPSLGNADRLQLQRFTVLPYALQAHLTSSVGNNLLSASLVHLELMAAKHASGDAMLKAVQ